MLHRAISRDYGVVPSRAAIALVIVYPQLRRRATRHWGNRFLSEYLMAIMAQIRAAPTRGWSVELGSAWGSTPSESRYSRCLVALKPVRAVSFAYIALRKRMSAYEENRREICASYQAWQPIQVVPLHAAYKAPMFQGLVTKRKKTWANALA